MRNVRVLAMTILGAAVAICALADTTSPNSGPETVNQHQLPGDGVWQERPFRLPDIPPESLSSEQKRVNDEVNHFLSTKQTSGPFRFWIADPRVLEGVLALIKAENTSKALSPRLTRLVAITIARQWKAQFEWFAQAPLAKRDGISPEVIEAIRLGKRPKFARADEELVYDAVNEIDRTKSLSDATFDRLYSTFGREGVAEFINYDSIFTFVGLTIKALQIKAPAPFPADPMP